MNRSLFWFRNDLRTHDNLGLAAARAEGDMLALFIATPAQWDAHDDAPIKRDYWRRNLALLQTRLAALNIPLLYAEAPTYADIPALFETLLPLLQVGSVHGNREYPLNERHRDETLAELCKKLGIEFTLHDDQVLTPPTSLLNKSGAPFKVFTPYARTARDRLAQRGLPEVAALTAQNPQTVPAHALLKDLDELTWPAADPTWATRWPAGEEQAHERLEYFCVERIAQYRERRDYPALEGTSRLSPQLAAGVLSVRECWRQSQLWQDGNGVETWRGELLWRDFYKSVMWHFPHVCRHLPWRSDVAHVPWRHDAEAFQRWCEGNTGIPIIDAAMRQLLQTGWMHNRLRMLVATFLSKHLLIDWRWGERFFMQHLIDGDFAANNGGWQWSASTGTDAVPYFRVFNPVTQSQRFDSEGSFIRTYVPELAELDAHEIHAPGLFRPAGYPPPMIDLAFGRERALNAFKG